MILKYSFRNGKNSRIFSIFADFLLEPTPTERRERLLQYMDFDEVNGMESCKICGKRYVGSFKSVRQRNLMNHIERVHLKIQAYKCEFCPKRFNSKAHKSNHLTLKHREEHKQLRETESNILEPIAFGTLWK